MVMCGAVPASLLVNVPPRTTATTIGTSPAPARDDGSVKSTKSQPGIFGLRLIDVAVMLVVPTVTVTAAPSVTFRVPLKLTCRIVGASVPVLSGDITLNGSVRQVTAA